MFPISPVILSYLIAGYAIIGTYTIIKDSTPITKELVIDIDGNPWTSK